MGNEGKRPSFQEGQAEAPAVEKVTSEEPQQQLPLGQESSGVGKTSGAGWHSVHDSWPCGDFMSL